MAIKPTGYPPLPHGHEDLNDLRIAQAGAIDRYYAPFCRVVKEGDMTLATGADIYMTTGWTTVHDNANMVRLYGVGGINFLRVVIPMAGFYDVNWSCYIDGTGSSVTSAAVVLGGGAVVENSIINAQGASNGWSRPVARDVVYLAQGSVLYFAAWQNTGSSKSLKGTWFGGSRTQVTVKWIGR